jgi:hypothetical protein
MPQNTRPIYVRDDDAPRLYASLVAALGREALEKHLKKVNKEIKSEKGAYLHEWTLPRNRLWLGLQKLEAGLGSGRANLSDVDVRIALEASAVIERVGNPVLLSKSQSWAHRLINEDQTSPILFEMKTAAGLWQAGYDIHWEATGPQPRRSCEFVAVGPDLSLEVECKSQSADAGRKVTRPRFYRLVDELSQRLFKRNIVGTVDVLVPKRMPGEAEWRREVVSSVEAMAASGVEQTRVLADDTEISTSLIAVGRLILPPGSLGAELDMPQAPFAHVATVKSKNSGMGDRRIVIRVRSRVEDHVLDAIYTDLKDATHQFTGNRAAIIYVFVPEVTSFEGLQSGSSIATMSDHYFREYAPPFIQFVAYVSDGQLFNAGFWLQGSSPALVFHNALYDERFGPSIRLLS